MIEKTFLDFHMNLQLSHLKGVNSETHSLQFLNCLVFSPMSFFFFNKKRVYHITCTPMVSSTSRKWFSTFLAFNGFLSNITDSSSGSVSRQELATFLAIILFLLGHTLNYRLFIFFFYMKMTSCISYIVMASLHYGLFLQNSHFNYLLNFHRRKHIFPQSLHSYCFSPLLQKLILNQVVKWFGFVYYHSCPHLMI